MPKPYVPRDRLANQASALGYLARSAFKLQAINAKFKIIKPGNKVLDLGASPGSWLQVAAELIGRSGLAVGVDTSPIKFAAANIKIITHDVLDLDLDNKLAPYAPFDAVLSDLAPKTSGIRDRDQALSLELASRALELTSRYLRLGGRLVIKIFQSPDTRNFVRQAKTIFKIVHLYKPPASRDRSFETYLIGLNKIDPASREKLG